MQLLRDLLASVDGLEEADLIDGEDLKPGEEALDIKLTLDQKKLYTRYAIMVKAAKQKSRELYRSYLLALAEYVMVDDTNAATAAKEAFDRAIVVLNYELTLVLDALFVCIKMTNPGFATENIVAIRKGWKVAVNDEVPLPVMRGMNGGMFSIVGQESQW